MAEQAAAIQVRLGDGRLEAFEPDRLCRALFAATEALGRPDAFLARELTDRIVEVLGDEDPGPLTLAELSEQVVKFLRELGHPALARRYVDRADIAHSAAPILAPRLWELLAPLPPPAEVSRRLAEPRLNDLALTDVFSRDVVSVCRDGLLVLDGHDYPFELAGSVLHAGLNPSIAGQGLAAAIAAARLHTGRFVALDGPEFALAALDGKPAELAATWAREFRQALRSANLSGVVNLNHALAPPWATELGAEPLFAGVRRSLARERTELMAEALAGEFLAAGSGEELVEWHLSGTDLTGEPSPRLLSLAASAIRGGPVEFVFDRPRAALSLGAGLSRKSPAALLPVGIHLPRLAEQVSPRTPERFFPKLGSLARLARSAGHAKMDFLRRHGRPDVTRGFLLDRSRLVVVPVGLDEAVRMLSDCPLCDQGIGTELGRRIVQQLSDALTSEAPHNMNVVLDSAPGTGLGFVGYPSNRRDVAGVTPSDGDASPRAQLRAAGTLHSVTETGAAFLRIDKSLSADDAAALLKQAWHQTEIHRLRFVPPLPLQS